MVLLFYTTYISLDLAQHEIFRAKVGKRGIKSGTSYYSILYVYEHQRRCGDCGFAHWLIEIF